MKILSWFIFRKKKDLPKPPSAEEIAARSPFKIALRKLKKHKLALGGFWVLVVLYTVALFAGFFAPYHYDSDSDMAYQPPQKICFDGLRPYVHFRESQLKLAEWRTVVDTSRKYYIRFFSSGEAYRLLWLFDCNIHLFTVDKPARIFIFGSDWNGRDLFSRLCYGARVSLSVGLIGVFIAFTLGLVVGGTSGYFGGAIDLIIMRFVEILMSIPAFYLMLALRSAMPLDWPTSQIYLGIVVIMAFLGWPGLARVIRGMVLSIKEMEFVVAAQAIGMSKMKIIVKHVLPNTFSYAIVAATLSIPGYILGESALSLLGLGITEPEASWGNMLTAAMNPSNLVNYPWIITPGFFIFIAIMAFNLFGDGLRDAFDPRSIH